jgi:hypothetical protein
VKIKGIGLMVMMLVCTMLCTTLFVTADHVASITIEYEPGRCSFAFYKIAEVDEDGSVTVISPFDEYQDTTDVLKDIDVNDSDALRVLCSTLETLIVRDNITPKYEVATDNEGNLKIEGVELGIYVILGDKITKDGVVYSPSPILVSVPNIYDVNSEAVYDICIKHSKYEKEELEDEKTELKVLKLWCDDGNEDKRPKSISVTLLKNGEKYETVVLDADNNWKYVWDNLSAEYTWTVVENNVPEGYSMTVEKDKTVFVIKNTYTTPPPPPPNLPPTGQLWWPVPVMLIVGSISFTVGWLRRRYL